MTRTGLELAPVLRSRRASRPGCFGIARSSKRISGFNCRASLTASAPSEASPNTFKFGSASRSRRNPSRKIGWSSAITIRTGCDFLKFIRNFSTPRNLNFQTSSHTGIRFYSESALNQTNTFLDDRRPLAHLVQFVLAEASGEGKAIAVIFHGQAPLAGIRAQAHQGVARFAVLAHVDQALLHNPQEFPANLIRHFQPLGVGDETGEDSRLALKSFHCIAHHAEESSSVHIDRLHLLHQFPQLQDLLAQQTLNPVKFAANHFRRRSRLTAT